MPAEWTQVVESALSQITSRTQSVGCSARELEAFQLDRQIKLPQAYIKFLKALGSDSGEFLQGSDLLIDRLDRLQTMADGLLRESGCPPLPPTAFVFCDYQDYQFLFFHTDQSPDPAVYHYLEGDAAAQCVAESFSAWLAQTALKNSQCCAISTKLDTRLALGG